MSWRVGTKVPLNVYDGDRPVCQCHTLEDAARIVSVMNAERLAEYLRRQEEWSSRTFGAGTRTLGILRHIQKELNEILDKPLDLSEWIDVMILAMDGYWRHGGDPWELMADLEAKQEKNFARVWPAPGPQDQPTEHVRG